MTRKFLAAGVLALFSSVPIGAQPPVLTDPAKILIEAEVLDLTGKPVEARALLDQVLATSGLSVELRTRALLALSRVHRKTGALDLARSALESIVSELPESDAMHRLARSYLTELETGKPENAAFDWIGDISRRPELQQKILDLALELAYVNGEECVRVHRQLAALGRAATPILEGVLNTSTSTLHRQLLALILVQAGRIEHLPVIFLGEMADILVQLLDAELEPLCRREGERLLPWIAVIGSHSHYTLSWMRLRLGDMSRVREDLVNVRGSNIPGLLCEIARTSDGAAALVDTLRANQHEESILFALLNVRPDLLTTDLLATRLSKVNSHALAQLAVRGSANVRELVIDFLECHDGAIGDYAHYQHLVALLAEDPTAITPPMLDTPLRDLSTDFLSDLLHKGRPEVFVTLLVANPHLASLELLRELPMHTLAKYARESENVALFQHLAEEHDEFIGEWFQFLERATVSQLRWKGDNPPKGVFLRTRHELPLIEDRDVLVLYRLDQDGNQTWTPSLEMCRVATETLRNPVRLIPLVYAIEVLSLAPRASTLDVDGLLVSIVSTTKAFEVAWLGTYALLLRSLATPGELPRLIAGLRYTDAYERVVVHGPIGFMNWTSERVYTEDRATFRERFTSLSGEPILAAILAERDAQVQAAALDTYVRRFGVAGLKARDIAPLLGGAPTHPSARAYWLSLLTSGEKGWASTSRSSSKKGEEDRFAVSQHLLAAVSDIAIPLEVRVRVVDTLTRRSAIEGLEWKFTEAIWQRFYSSEPAIVESLCAARIGPEWSTVALAGEGSATLLRAVFSTGVPCAIDQALRNYPESPALYQELETRLTDFRLAKLIAERLIGFSQLPALALAFKALNAKAPPEVRRSAIGLVKKLPDVTSLKPLVALLDDDDFAIRREALTALEEIKITLAKIDEWKEAVGKLPDARVPAKAGN
ncbi:MAG: HEAT repeat domain-containing protein [Planctomycetota bacterium]